LRPDQRRIRIERDVEIKLRQLQKLRRDRRTLRRRRIGPRLDPIVCARTGCIGNANAIDATASKPIPRRFLENRISGIPPR
jgi:hypothetical protein